MRTGQVQYTSITSSGHATYVLKCFYELRVNLTAEEYGGRLRRVPGVLHVVESEKGSKTSQGQAEWAVHAQETNWQVVLADESGGGSYGTTGFDTGVTWHGHYKSVRGGGKNCTVHATCIAKGNAGQRQRACTPQWAISC